MCMIVVSLWFHLHVSRGNRPRCTFEPVSPPAKVCNLSKPFNDLFKIKGDEELQNQPLMLRDEQNKSQKSPDVFESWAADAVKLLSPQEQHTAKTVTIAGLSMCNQCQWQSGCAKCDFSKCVRYYFNRSLVECGLSKESARTRHANPFAGMEAEATKLWRLRLIN